jgi:mannonate dehydratase
MPAMQRRHFLCCGAAAAGLFTSLSGRAALLRPCPTGLPEALQTHPLLQACWAGLDPAQVWDVHAHLLGTGDSGSGCRVDPRMDSWWHPVEALRKRVILRGAGVPGDALSLDRAYVERLRQLAADFPAGARWMLFAFDEACDANGRADPAHTSFHVPNAYAAAVAAAHPERFAWVASIHPYREDALERLEQAVPGGAVALKWLPASMAIDLRDPRLRPFYDRLARARLPLIVHCGDEHAVPGAGRQDLGNPLHVRAALARGVRVVVAHCASLGTALDLDRHRPRLVSAFELFARLMEEEDARHRLLGDVSAVFQFNRDPAVWQALLNRQHWHTRLLHGSDYPLPGVALTVPLGRLTRAGLLTAGEAQTLETLREHNPLLFDLALKRTVRWQGQAFAASVFETRAHFERVA